MSLDPDGAAPPLLEGDEVGCESHLYEMRPLLRDTYGTLPERRRCVERRAPQSDQINSCGSSLVVGGICSRG